MVTPYSLIGEKAGIDFLVERFYFYMETLPEAKECLMSHPGGVIRTREKLKDFLSGWLGGPNLYIEKYGHPKMRMRHLPFAISQIEVDQWMLCMKLAVDDLSLENTFAQQLKDAFGQFAQHMKNK